MGIRFVPAALALIAGCASAGRDGGGGGGTPDANGPTHDAPIAIDAAIDGPASAGCASADTCTGAMMLGSVSGDTGNQKLTATGYQAAWFRVRVTEDDSDVFGLTLRIGATLTSPSGAAFHPLIYVNTGSDVVECASQVGTLSSAGNVDTVHAEWGEGTFSNGSDDGRYASIEVRPVGTGCAANQMWQLEIEGDWN